MNKEQFVKGLKYLGVAYNKEFTEEQATVWFDFFKDTDYEVFRQAVKRIIPKSKYLPSIAELKEEIAVLNNPMLQLDVDEEWNSVIQAIRRYGNYNSIEAFESMKPETREIVKTIGWYRLCMSENIEFERRTFKELFNNKQVSAKKIGVINKPQLTLGELTKLAEAKNINLLEGGTNESTM